MLVRGPAFDARLWRIYVAKSCLGSIRSQIDMGSWISLNTIHAIAPIMLVYGAYIVNTAI